MNNWVLSRSIKLGGCLKFVFIIEYVVSYGYFFNNLFFGLDIYNNWF